MKTVENPICEHCATRVENYGSTCLDLLNDVCRLAIDQELAYYHQFSGSQVRQIIAFLELKRYVVTAELDQNWIGIRPNMRNCRYDSENKNFCWCDNEV